MKKLMSFLLVAAACTSMAVTAMADGVEMRAPSCPDCGGVLRYVSSSKVLPKYTVEECIRGGKKHDDIIRYYEYTEGYDCESCDYSDVDTWVEDMRDCPMM